MISELIDERLSFWLSKDANSLPGEIPVDMQTGKKEDDWVYWKPISSTVSDAEIKQIEDELKVKLSAQYVEVLKHKHFMELYIGEVSLLPHPSKGWKEVILKSTFGGYPRKYLIDKGYLPFANFSDWGLWCFKLDEKNESGEYAIYLWDHERAEEYKRVADDLYSGLLDQRNQPPHYEE